MKIKNVDAIHLFEAINHLRDCEIPYNIGLIIEDNYDELMKVTEKYSQEEAKLVEKFSEKDEKGNPILVNNSFRVNEQLIQEFLKCRKDLDEHEKEVKLSPIPPSVISNIIIKPKFIKILQQYILDDN